jgi:AcrR family transcriptional regulator
MNQVESDRKSQIIKAAVKRFARHGLNKTTLDEIARDLRIGKATIYHYFKSKDELFYQTLEYDVSLFTEDITQIFNNLEMTLQQRFLEYFNYKEQVYEKYKVLYDLITRHLREETLENDIFILKKLLQNEEKVLRQVINTTQKNNTNLSPMIIIMQSWGILFWNKLNAISDPESQVNSKELVYKSLENMLNLITET